MFFRTNPIWNFVNIMQIGEGRTYKESGKLVRESLKIGGFDTELQELSLNWIPGSEKKTIQLKSDQVVNIPLSMKVFKIGLGWDTELDIDCSVMLFDEWGNCIESISIGKELSTDEAIMLSGNNGMVTNENESDNTSIQLQKISLMY